MSLFLCVTEIERLLAEYTSRFPDDDSLEENLPAFGEDGVLKMLRNSNGRRIEFICGQGIDEVDYRYVDQVKSPSDPAQTGPNRLKKK